jgi:hypothetical protein
MKKHVAYNVAYNLHNLDTQKRTRAAQPLSKRPVMLARYSLQSQHGLSMTGLDGLPCFQRWKIEVV